MEAVEVYQVGMYIRLSREDGDKEESDSVGNQKKLLMEYISKKKNLHLYEVYVDDGYSGTNFDRPNFKRMFEDITAGHINCVIVKDLSRFGRDYIDTGRYLERLFPELGVRFISVSDCIDSRKQAYDMLLPIKNIFNEQYARDISNKIQITMRAKQKAGEFIGSFSSYGYKKSPVNKNQLVVDEYAAEVVKRIFSLFIQGMGKQSIAKLLNEEGILCPSEYKKINGEKYKNANGLTSTAYWSYSTINSILHKEIYVGNMVQGTKHQKMRSKQKLVAKENWIIVENTHPPIIDHDTWELAQRLLVQKHRDIQLKSNHHIFAGLIRCGDCGRSMMKNSWRRSDGSIAYSFYCGTYKRAGKTYCTPHALPVPILEHIVLEDLNNIVRNIGDLQKLIEVHSQELSQTEKGKEQKVAKIKIELERVKNLKKFIYEDYKDGLISKEEYLSYRTDYVKKENLYAKQIETLQIKSSPALEQLETSWLNQLLTHRKIKELDRGIVVEMIEDITVYENHKLKIRYNFGIEANDFFSDRYRET